MIKKQKEGGVIAGVAVFCCLFFLIIIFYLRKSTQIQKIEWDVATTTAGDYTVDAKLTYQQYLNFVHQH